MPHRAAEGIFACLWRGFRCGAHAGSFARPPRRSRRHGSQGRAAPRSTTSTRASPKSRKIDEAAPAMNPNLSASNVPRGFKFAATHCGLKKTRLDLGILVSDVPAAAAAVFTTNQVVAAPVVASREHLRKSRGWMRGIIVNSGNANCCTRVDGYPASIAMAQKLAEELDGVDPAQILVCSTGVIGAPLRVKQILDAVPDLVRTRNSHAATFEEFARAIMTTDTRPKWAAAKGPHRRKASPPSRLRKRFRHDRAEYGDDACLHRHRRGNSARAALPRTESRRRAAPLIRSPSMATLRRTIPSQSSQTASPAPEKSQTQAAPISPLFPPRSKASANLSRWRSSKMARARSA